MLLRLSGIGSMLAETLAAGSGGTGCMLHHAKEVKPAKGQPARISILVL